MNKKLKCIVSIANIMLEATHKSERVSQLLYNDRVEVLGPESGNWIPIKSAYNGTLGWVLKGQFIEIDEIEFNLKPFSVYLPSQVEQSNWNQIPGTLFYSQDHTQSTQLQLVGNNIQDIEAILQMYMNSPYMWGGITPQGIDCSGLSKMLYRYLGIPLACYAAEQFNQGKILDFIQNAVCGDLAFFENDDHEISHVGILVNSSEIIHATEKAGYVVRDFIDQEGIISKKTGERTHKLRLIKRILN
ncbi:MAG TPA: NlpC/P60 family protein [Chitinophagaceae bacterium]|nr:NlpC/P60 family protein [Chitinophagaceae bacterium]